MSLSSFFQGRKDHNGFDEKIQQIKSGHEVSISLFELRDYIIDLKNAKINLPESQYLYLKGYYSSYEKEKTATLLDFRGYDETLKNTIKKLDRTAPYDKYYGKAGEDYLPLLPAFRQEYICSNEIIKELCDLYDAEGNPASLGALLSAAPAKSLGIDDELGKAFCGVLVYAKKYGRDWALYKFDFLEKYIIENPNNRFTPQGQQAVAYFCGLLIPNRLTTESENKILLNKYLKLLIEKLYGREEAEKFQGV